MGVFDLFHIGHLNLIRRARERCGFLRVGILSDELVIRQKKRPPIIPLGERMEIVASMRYVDEVIPITDSSLSKVEEWYKHPFDCLFSGSDYEDHPFWKYEKKELEKLGSTIEYFPYTETTNSTKIRALIEQAIE